MEILLYWDKGVEKHTGNETYHSLKSALDPFLHPVKKVNHSFLANEKWEARSSLLVIPGGRDIPYHELLKGPVNRKISQFVEEGGNYLGICAGAYYGSAFIEFEKGGPLEVCGTRELAFYPGIAQGPALGNGHFCYRSHAGVDAATIHVHFGPITDPFTAKVFYNGGCSFAMPEKYPSVTVLGRYQTHLSKEAAIVECRRGKGKAILCGVHPEVTAHSLAKLKNPHMEKIYSKLVPAEVLREKLWKLILSSFNL